MINAKIKSEFDPDLPYRKQTIKANNKTLVTPTKSFSPKQIHGSANFPKNVTTLNEIYHGVTSSKINDHLLGKDNSFTNQLNSLSKGNNNSDKEMQLCFLEFKDTKFPIAKEIEFMTDQAYIYSDITPIPMLNNIKDRLTSTIVKGEKKQFLPNEPKFKQFLKYLRNCIETIEQLNNKPIMGYIPNYRFYFKELISFYVKNGINTFYFDAHLSNPMTLHPSIRTLTRELNNEESLEQSFIHILNPGQGSASKDNSMIYAKDILGFGLGMDGLGERHMPPKFRPDFYKQMRDSPDNRSKLFLKNSYGYIKTADKKAIKEIFPKDSKVDITNFLTGKKPDPNIQKTFNIEQLSLEAKQLRQHLSENKSLLKYISKKENIEKSDIKILQKAKIPLRR